MANSKIIKTTKGNFNRDDKVAWGNYYETYLANKSLTDTASYLDIDIRSLRKIFTDLGYKILSRSEQKTGDLKSKTIRSKKGIVYDGLDKKFWEGEYEDYVLGNKSLEDKAVELGITRKQLTGIFNYHKFPKKTIEQKNLTEDNTNFKRYGSKRANSTPEFNLKMRRSIKEYNTQKCVGRLANMGYEILEEYVGLKNAHESGGFKSWITYRFRHTVCGHEFDDEPERKPRCPKCFSNRSSFEEDINSFIVCLGYTTLANSRDVISPLELDIHISESMMAFECNGVRWHSVNKLGMNKGYHKNKTELCLSKGIKLYHIWDFDDEEIIKSLIKTKLGKVDNRLYARKLELKGVGVEERRQFFNENHLHGDVGASFAFGLFDGEELVQAISFRKHKEGMEIARLATKLNTSVVGGFSKLLKYGLIHTKENYPEVDKIITYCDRDWTPDYKDSVYFKNGFNFVKDSGCMLKYYDENTKKVYSRETFMKHKLKEMFPDYTNLNVSNFLSSKNIHSVYNSGNWKFELDI